MAYRVLVIGDDVKVSCFGHEDHGQFGEVVGFVDGHVLVDLGGYKGTFFPKNLLVSTGNPYQMCLSQEDEDSFFHDEIPDGETQEELLARIAFVEKEVVDIKRLLGAQ